MLYYLLMLCFVMIFLPIIYQLAILTVFFTMELIFKK